MASKYAGKQGQFAQQIREFAEKANAAIDVTLREIIIEIGSSVIRMSPVGNPELWAENHVATQYNKAVDDHNSALRNDPANLTKNGRLKAGKKLNDGMDLVAGKDYVGGRFRANWHLSLDVVESVTFDETDQAGQSTIAALVTALSDFRPGQIAYIINNLPYGIPLEYGHSTQAPNGMVRVTLARFQQIVAAAAQHNKV
jgi:hypothetical protein